MTETVPPQAAFEPRPAQDDSSARVEATPLAALLGSTGAPPALKAYCGALTPRELGAREREIAALVAGAAVHDLGWLRRVTVGGEDRFRWLNGMVTNTVKELGANAGAWNLVLNAQGRIQGDLHVWREGDALELEIAADQCGRLLAHLDRFIVMDDVELTPQSLPSLQSLQSLGSRDAEGDPNRSPSGETALGLAGPEASAVLARLGWPEPGEPLTSAGAVWNGAEVRIRRAYGVLVPHYELWAPAEQIPALWRALLEAGATPVGAEALEALRIAEGIPAYGIDMAERDLPQETAQMRALNFDKGCYLGQEIVERIRSRASVHRSLRPLELFGPVPAAGVGLTAEDGTAAGHITSAAELPLPGGSRSFALAMIRRDAELPPRRESVAGSPGQPHPSLIYTEAGARGTARILDAPPDLRKSERGEQGPESCGSERIVR